MANIILLLTLVSSFQIIQSSVWYGSRFECHGRNKCYDDQIHCDDNRHCIIECSGPNACQYTVIHCPINAQCDVTCNNGIDACKDVIFLAERSSSLSISCDRSQAEACDETIIYCPNNGRSGPASCQISGINQINVKKKIEIFAIEGLNDVEITGTYINKAFLYCGLKYDNACTLIDTSPFKKCISTNKICENYLLPTSYPTKSPTIDPTSFPTDNPTPIPSFSDFPTVDPTAFPTDNPTPLPTHTPSFSDFPTIDPTAFPTDNPTPLPTHTPSHYPTYEPTPTPISTTTARPTFSEGHRTTKRPTVWSMPTTKKPDLDYSTTKYPSKTPTISPIILNRPTTRPTRDTKFGSLLTTTHQGGGYGVGDDNNGQVDPNGVEFNDKEMMSTNNTNYSPLYYVISALLISICYISVSLFCWVHYNHKYASRVMELKQYHHSQSRLQSPAIMPPGVVWQSNHLHEPGAAVPIAIANNNYLNTPIANNRLRYSNNSSNNTVPSVASNITAPTTISRNGISYNNIIEEEQHTIAPTSIKSHTHSINSLHSHSHYTENNSEFKEVDYETGGNNNINRMQQTSKYSMDSIEYNNVYIHDDENIVQYGETIKDGPTETHSLKVSNISDYNIKNRYNSVIIHGDLSEINDTDIEQENDIETYINQNEENEQIKPIYIEPIQPLITNINNKNLIMSPPVNESISFSGSSSQMYVAGNQQTTVLYTPQYGQ